MEEVIVSPRSVKRLNEECRTLCDQKKYREALVSAEEAMQLEPTNFTALTNYAEVLYWLGRHQEASECCDRILARKPMHARTLGIKASSQLILENYDEAHTLADAALEKNPNQVRALGVKAACLYEEKNFPEALAYAERALEKEPEHGRSLNIKADCLCEAGEYEKALELVELVLKDKPHHTRSLLIKATCLFELHRAEESLRCIQTALQKYPRNLCALNLFQRVTGTAYNFNKWIQGGFFFMMLQDYREALRQFTEALKIFPQDVESLYFKSMALFRLEQYDEMVACVEFMQQIEPQSFPARSLPTPVGENKFEWLNPHEETLLCANKTLEVAPNDPMGLQIKSQIMWRMGNYEKSIELADQLLEIDPKCLFAWLEKAEALRRQGNYAEAVRCCDEVIAVDEKSGKAALGFSYSLKGIILFCEGNKQEAAECFHQALMVDATEVFALQGKAFCAFYDGELENAEKLLLDVDEKLTKNLGAYINEYVLQVRGDLFLLLKQYARAKEVFERIKAAAPYDFYSTERLAYIADCERFFLPHNFPLGQPPLRIIGAVRGELEEKAFAGQHQDVVNRLENVSYRPFHSIKGFSLFCLGRFEEAEKSFNDELKNIAINWDTLPHFQGEFTRAKKFAFQGKALCLWQKGEKDTAEKLLGGIDIGLMKNPDVDTPAVLWQRGELFWCLREYQAAARAFESIPNLRVIYYFKARGRLVEISKMKYLGEIKDEKKDEIKEDGAPQNQVVREVNDILLQLDEIRFNQQDKNSYYTADFINALVCCRLRQDRELPIYVEPAVVEMEGEYFEEVIGNILAQDKAYAFIPLCVAYDRDTPHAKNHWVAIVVDKPNQRVFYLDPAQQTAVPRCIQLLQARLGFTGEIIQNPFDFQQKEKTEGFVRHCGAYTVEIFEVFERLIREGRMISEEENGISLEAALSRIPCGEADTILEIRNKHIEVVQRIVQARAEVPEAPPQRATASGSDKGKEEADEVPVDKKDTTTSGPKPQASRKKDEPSRKKNSPKTIFRAVEEGDLRSMQWFVENGVDPLIKQHNGVTAIEIATFEARKDKLEKIDFLLEAGCDFSHEIFRFIVVGDLENIERCFSNALDLLDIADSRGRTSLHYACAMGNVAVVRRLLEVCPQLLDKKVGAWWGGPVHFAACNGHLDVVRYLVEIKNVRLFEEDDGIEAISETAGRGHLDVVKYWLERPNVLSGENNHLLNDMLREAVRQGQLHVVRYLIDERNVSPYEGFSNGAELLLYAVRGGHLNVVRYLVDEKNISPTANDRNGYSALHYAVMIGFVDIVQYLVGEKNVSPAEKDKNNYTTLLRAAANGHLDIVRYLVGERNVSPTEKNNDGDTPLLLAAKWGYLDIVKYLVGERNVSPTEKNNDGNTPLFSSAGMGHLDIVKYLVEEKNVSLNEEKIYGYTVLEHSENFPHVKLWLEWYIFLSQQLPVLLLELDSCEVLENILNYSGDKSDKLIWEALTTCVRFNAINMACKLLLQNDFLQKKFIEYFSSDLDANLQRESINAIIEKMLETAPDSACATYIRDKNKPDALTESVDDKGKDEVDDNAMEEENPEELEEVTDDALPPMTQAQKRDQFPIAILMYHFEQYEKTVEIIDNILNSKCDPDIFESEQFEALILKAQSLIKLEKYEQAIFSIETALQLQPEGKSCLSYMGVAHFCAGHYDEAAKCFDAALAFNSNDEFAVQGKAFCYFEKDEEDEGEELLLKVAEIRRRKGYLLFSSSLRCHLMGLGGAAIEYKRLRGEANYYWHTSGLLRSSRILRSHYDQLLPAIAGSSCRAPAPIHSVPLSKNDLTLEEALICVDEILAKNTDAIELQFWKIKVLSTLNRCEEAQACAEEILTKYPHDLDAFIWKLELGRRRNLQQNRVEMVEAFFAGTFPRSPLALLMRALVFAGEWQNEQAMVCVDAILAADNENIDAWFLKIDLLTRTKRHDLIVECAEQLVAANIPDVFVMLAIGTCISADYRNSHPRRTEAALICAEGALKIEPDNIKALMLKIGMLEKLGRNEEAMSCADILLEIEPENRPARIAKSRAFLKRGEYENALMWIDEVLKKPVGYLDLDGWYVKVRALQRLNRYEDIVIFADALWNLKSDPHARPDYERFILEFKVRALIVLGRYEEALEYAESAPQMQLSRPQALLNKGAALFFLGNYGDALAIFEDELIDDPADSFISLGKALCLFAQGEVNRAEEILEELHIQSPNELHPFVNVNLWTQEGDFFFALGEYARARAAFENAQEIEPNNFYLQKRLRDIETALVQEDEVEQNSGVIASERVQILDAENLRSQQSLKEKAANTEGVNPNVIITKENGSIIFPEPEGLWLSTVGEMINFGSREIEECLSLSTDVILKETIEARKEGWEWCFFNTMLWGMLGHYANVLRYAEKLLENDPKFSIVRYLQSNALRLQGNYPAALEEADKLLEILTAEKEAADVPTLLVKADCLMRMGEYDAALATIDVALQLVKCGVPFSMMRNPLREIHHDQTWCMRGLILTRLGKYEDALKCFNEALEIDENICALVNKGRLLLEKGNYDAALECFEETLVIDYKYALQAKAVVLFHQGKLEEAEELFQKVEVLLKNETSSLIVVDMWNQRGDLFFALKNFESAKAAFEKAQELDPNDFYARKRLQDIHNLENPIMHVNASVEIFEEIKSIAQQDHQPAAVEVVPQAKPAESKPRKNNVECMYEPAAAVAPSDKDRSALFIVYPIMGGTQQTKEFSKKLDKRVLDKNNLAVYVWRSPLLAMNCDSPEYKAAWEAFCSMEKQAEQAIAEIKAVQPHGPYYLCGWSFGGSLTLEIARQLRLSGEKVKYIALIDPQTPARLRSLNQAALKGRLLQHINYISGLLLGDALQEEKLLTFNNVDCEKEALIHAAFGEVFTKLENYRDIEGYAKLKGILWALYANYLAIYGYYPEELFKEEDRLPAVTVYVAEELPANLPEPEYYPNDFAGITKVKLDEPLVEGVNHFDIVLKDQMANLLTKQLENITKIKLSNKLWMYLERHYQTLEFSSLQFLYDDKPFDIRSCQFNVSSASAGVQLNTLFDEDTQIRHALVVGDAGVGKTVLARQLTLQNMNSKVWKQKKWIFYIPLHTLANVMAEEEYPLSQAEHAIESLLYHGIFKVFGVTFEQVAAFWAYIKKEPRPICFILDGLDEIPQEVGIDNALRALSMQKCAVVMTTRNYHLGRLRAVGFNSDAKFRVELFEADSLAQSFIPGYFDSLGVPEKALTLLKWLQTNPVMREFVQNPLHLTMICSIWSRFEAKIIAEEKQLLDIFNLTVKNMFRRFSGHARLVKLMELNDLSDAALYEMAQEVSEFLQVCAFERIREGSRELTSEQINALLKRCGSERHFFAKVLSSGFLQATHYAQYDIDRNFQFNNRSMELYFGCQYVVRCLNSDMPLSEEQTENIKHFIEIVRNAYDPGLIESLLIVALNKTGHQRFVALFAESVKESHDVRSLTLLTRALEIGERRTEEIESMQEVPGPQEMREVIEITEEGEVTEELGETLYCLTTYFDESYKRQGNRHRADLDNRGLMAFKAQLENLKIQCPKAFNRFVTTKRFGTGYKGNEGVLHYAVRRRSVRLLKLLLTFNANTKMRSDDDDKTPLMLAESAEVNFAEGVALLKAYEVQKAKQTENDQKRERFAEHIKREIIEKYIAAWKEEKAPALDVLLNKKLALFGKMQGNHMLSVKDTVEIFNMFERMVSYANDEVLQEAVCELISTQRHNFLAEKIFSFYDEIFRNGVPKAYKTFYLELMNILIRAEVFPEGKSDRYRALEEAVRGYAENKNWLKEFLNNALKIVCTDNVTKAVVITHLLEKYKRNPLFERADLTLRLKDLLGYLCETAYKAEIDAELAERLEEFNPEVPLLPKAAPAGSKVAPQLPFFQRKREEKPEEKPPQKPAKDKEEADEPIREVQGEQKKNGSVQAKGRR